MSQAAEYRPLVWITDDSPMEAAFTEHSLGKGYDFEHFRDGSLVIEKIAAGGRLPDLLLLDWMMPVMRGDEVCRFLRSHPQTRDLPIIIVTASRIETRDVVEGLSIGANDYVPRPFVPEELRARVDSAIRAKRLREAANREQLRLAVIGKLGRSFLDIGPSVDAILEALAATLVEGLCDGCTITLAPGALPGVTMSRHRTRRDEYLLSAFAVMDACTFSFETAADARNALPAAYHPAIDRFGMSALAVMPFPLASPVNGVITAMRDGGSVPFVEDDVRTIQTCLEYTAIAFQNVLRFEAERAIREQLETILEHMPISVIVADTSGTLTHVNQIALNEMPALRTARTLEGLKDIMSVTTLAGQPIQAHEAPLARALRGEASRGLELELSVNEEQTKTLRLAAAPLRDMRGEVTSAVVAFDDITTERQAQRELERAAEFQKYVLGIVSHDLRSPLQTVTMGLETIKVSAAADPNVLRIADRSLTAGRRMGGIIEQLLDVVRTQLGGGIPLEPADVNLDEVVTEVLDELALAYPTARFESHLDRVRGIWDPERLAQVVSNIVGNAVQHGAETSPVWIETERAGDTALLRVRNTSKKALTDEQRASIFRPFRRTETASRGSGLGLGLYIASEILRAHHGDISVASDPETTTFTIRLPLIAPPQA